MHPFPNMDAAFVWEHIVPTPKKTSRAVLAANELARRRERDAARKRKVRKAMSEKQRQIEREKDALRKVVKRVKKKEQDRIIKAMRLERILN